MKKLFLSYLSLLASCSLEPTQSNVDRLAAEARLRDTAPLCDMSNCQKKWEAAQVWVTQNSAFKIQNATTAIIQTYNPTDGDPRLGFELTKAPYSEDKYIIQIRAFCANWLFGCNPNPIEASQAFNNYINSIK